MTRGPGERPSASTAGLSESAWARRRRLALREIEIDNNGFLFIASFPSTIIEQRVGTVLGISANRAPVQAMLSGRDRGLGHEGHAGS